jgi:hypothetical protein
MPTYQVYMADSQCEQPALPDYGGPTWCLGSRRAPQREKVQVEVHPDECSTCLVLAREPRRQNLRRGRQRWRHIHTLVDETGVAVPGQPLVATRHLMNITKRPSVPAAIL